MPLIDYTYFAGGELNIPRLEVISVKENVDLMIGKREPELLTDLFGVKMYEDFVAGIAEVPIQQRWVDLKDGKVYQDASGEYFKWRGLVNAAKESLIANYVYYWYMRKISTHTTPLGEAAANSANSSRVSPRAKMERAWDEMVHWIWEMYHFLETKSDIYPELRRCNDHKWRVMLL